MQRGESCVVRCGSDGAGDRKAWTDEALKLEPPSTAAVVDMMVTLIWCEKEKDVMEMSPTDRVLYAGGRKDAAAKYFKAERYTAALHKYQLVSQVLEYTKDLKEESAAKGMRRVSKVNEAACCLKLDDLAGAIKVCSEVLAEQPDNEKALYRRGTAFMKLGEYVRAESDLTRCVRANPENQEARRMLQQCKTEAKESGKDQKGVYAKMLGQQAAGRRRQPA
eukprot:gnl/TRDRNA2_/TRDRNA2_35358_c0_seq2.p1 gnl/TRDRNA2_/TRDRNA2_35358_c0~~gnl/TRDRNA2_/TRDRNA2_35358_c0_seq2.p1  ORF type:complete len:221 (+),score=54.39 gnl/TRDRNA2_/TRDRNA2_35358_c0_seq2:408-1070(+)